MSSVIQINGVPVSIHGVFDREVKDDSGQKVAEREVVVMIRGRMQNKQFIQLITRDLARLDYLDGPRPVTMFARIGNHTSVGSGEGEGAMFRHDLTFRELPDSYQRRKSEELALRAEVVESPLRRRSTDLDREEIEDISEVTIGTNVSQWGDAIRLLKDNVPRPRVAEEPMTQVELAAIEVVLTNLRIDALIDQLDAAGIILRGAVDDGFRSLIDQRFVAEAIPLVGERVAKRAVRELG